MIYGDPYSSQPSSDLIKLPLEVVDEVLATLDIPSRLSFRQTCRFGHLCTRREVCKLFKDRKFFLHPYSFDLLTQLSKSPLADCVERIIIGTETFQRTFHLSPEVYRPALTAAFKRFPSLRAVEIRDEFDHDTTYPPINTLWTTALGIGESDNTNDGRIILDPPRLFDPYDVNYHTRWGEEATTLQSQGLRHIQTKLDCPPRQIPSPWISNDSENLPYRGRQLGQLLCAVLEACTAAKEVGVGVKDIRLALVGGGWGIQDFDIGQFYRSDMDDTTKKTKESFLSSLEVLHLVFSNEGRMHSGPFTLPFLSACSNLKWLRLGFRRTGGWACSATEALDSLGKEDVEYPLSSKLERLDLSDMVIPPDTLISLVKRVRPKFLNIWSMRLDAPWNGELNLWAAVLRQVAPIVERIRLAAVSQLVVDLHKHHVHFKPDRRMVLELPGCRGTWKEDVEEIIEDMLFYDGFYVNW